MYCVNGKHFADLYRNKISGYADWCEQELGCGFYFNTDNIGPYMSLDETCLSNGEVKSRSFAHKCAASETETSSSSDWSNSTPKNLTLLTAQFNICTGF